MIEVRYFPTINKLTCTSLSEKLSGSAPIISANFLREFDCLSSMELGTVFKSQ